MYVLVVGFRSNNNAEVEHYIAKARCSACYLLVFAPRHPSQDRLVLSGFGKSAKKQNCNGQAMGTSY